MADLLNDTRGESSCLSVTEASLGPNPIKCAETLAQHVFHDIGVSPPASGRSNPNLAQEMLVQ